MNTSVFVSAGIAGGVLLTCAALHITYLGMRAKRESEAMLRRARYPWWILVIVDIFLVGFGSFFAFVLSVILTPSAGTPIVIVLFAVPMCLIFALFLLFSLYVVSRFGISSLFLRGLSFVVVLGECIIFLFLISKGTIIAQLDLISKEPFACLWEIDTL